MTSMKRPLPPVRWSRCQKAYGTRFSFATLRGHTRSSQSQSTVTKTSLVFFDQQFGSLLNTQIESLAANRYGDGDVNAATFSRRVTQVPHTCCRLFSSLQLQVCLRLSGSIVPRWSHLISVFRLYCDHCLIMPLAPQVNRTEDPIAAPGYDLRARCSSW